MTSTAQFLESLSARGVRVWTDAGQVCFEAARGILTADDIGALRERKAQIIQHYAQIEKTMRPISMPPTLTLAVTEVQVPAPAVTYPLTFVQDAYWQHLYRGEYDSDRSMVITARLRGQLDESCLRDSLQDVVGSHESLRARITDRGQQVFRPFDRSRAFVLEIVDLRMLLLKDAESKASAEISESSQAVVPMAGPLWCVTLYRLANADHILAIVLSHLIADGMSLDILRRELFTSYQARYYGLKVPRAAFPHTFHEHIDWLMSSDEGWCNTHQRYWTERFADAPLIQFPGELQQGKNASLGVQTEAVHIGNRETLALCGFARQHRTTLAMCVLSLYVSALRELCDMASIVIPVIVSGRHRVEQTSTIGLFSYPMFLRIDVDAHLGFAKLVRQVTDEYASSLRHADYGRMQRDFPDVAARGAFNWLPAKARGGVAVSEFALCDRLTIGAFEVKATSVRRIATGDPRFRFALCLCHTDEGIVGNIGYREDLWQRSAIVQLAKTLEAGATRVLSAL